MRLCVKNSQCSKRPNLGKMKMEGVILNSIVVNCTNNRNLSFSSRLTFYGNSGRIFYYFNQVGGAPSPASKLLGCNSLLFRHNYEILAVLKPSEFSSFYNIVGYLIKNQPILSITPQSSRQAAKASATSFPL